MLFRSHEPAFQSIKRYGLAFSGKNVFQRDPYRRSEGHPELSEQLSTKYSRKTVMGKLHDKGGGLCQGIYPQNVTPRSRFTQGLGQKLTRGGTVVLNG